MTVIYKKELRGYFNGMMGYALGMLEFRGQKLLVSLMIALTTLSFTLMGDGLRDALDPRLRR